MSAKLAMLHSKKRPQLPSADDPKPEVLYHMVPTAQWEAAKATGSAYYPTTFHEDGDYTHATAVPSRLITTANHFYQDVAGEWVCLRFTRSALRRCGIVVRDEEAKPVGNQPVGEDWGDWVCPHVLGGIRQCAWTRSSPCRETARPLRRSSASRMGRPRSRRQRRRSEPVSSRVVCVSCVVY